jgi:hypothetical protein
MKSFGDCLFCEGTGKCEECSGTGKNPHINSSVPECPHCSGTGSCPECDGSGKSPLGRPRKGSVLKYGLLWAAGLIGFFGLMTVVDNRIFTAIGMVAWSVFLYVLFYRDSQRKKSSPPSRF